MLKKKLLLAVALMSASAVSVAQLQVTATSYDKNVLGVINATEGSIDIALDGEAVQLSDSNYVMPCSPTLILIPKTVQVTVPAAGYDEVVTCPVFVTIEETE